MLQTSPKPTYGQYRWESVPCHAFWLARYSGAMLLANFADWI
jgi:hypothetical protein